MGCLAQRESAHFESRPELVIEVDKSISQNIENLPKNAIFVILGILAYKEAAPKTGRHGGMGYDLSVLVEIT